VISVVFERNGAGLYLHAPTPIDASRYASIEFLCRAEGGPQVLLLSVQDERNQSLGSVSFGKIGGHPPVGSWKRYEVPLSQLDAAGKKISGITIQAVGTVTRNPVYFDSIRIRPAP
jgi:hypothetical protein